jgi:AraC-like DNA-binding protein
MHYQQFAPPEQLKELVRYFWVLEDRDANALPKTFMAIADGSPGIIFHQSEKGKLFDQGQQPLPDVILYGQTIEPVKFHTTGPFSAIGIYFYPHALKTIFGLDAIELTNTCIDLLLLPNRKKHPLADQLANTPVAVDQVKAIAEYLFSQMVINSAKNDRLAEFALTKLIQSKGSASLKEVQRTLQLTERTFERRFRQSVGISAKLFARIRRFQEGLHQLRNNKYEKLSDIAYDNEYADQAHFIRSFKEFTGHSPNQYQKQVIEVVESFPVIKSIGEVISSKEQA